MMKVVIDTNVLISRFLSPAGVPARIFEYLEHETFDLVVSEAILMEYGKVLRYKGIQARHGFDEDKIGEVVENLRKIATIVEVDTALNVVQADPDDNKFLECAISGKASYIISGDTHLLQIKQYQTVQILSPTDFLALLPKKAS